MSATNRGSNVRNKDDYYITPEWAILKFLENYSLDRDGIIFEPSAGNGAFIKALRKKKYYNTIISNEIRKEERSNLKIISDICYFRDYLDTQNFINEDFRYQVKTVITNPPYKYAIEFIENSLYLFPNAEIIMLLRINFFGAQKRYDFWQRNMVTDLHVLSKRPSFREDGGTDATEYAYFIWNGKGGGIKVI